MAASGLHTVFISHKKSPEVEDRALWILDVLKAQGIDAFFDRKDLLDITEEALRTHVTSSRCLITIITPDVFNSKWVEQENSWALQARIPIIPFFDGDRHRWSDLKHWVDRFPGFFAVQAVEYSKSYHEEARKKLVADVVVRVFGPSRLHEEEAARLATQMNLFGQPPEEQFNALARTVANHFNACCCMLAVCDQETWEALAWYYKDPAGKESFFSGIRAPMRRTLCMYAMAHGFFLSEDITVDAETPLNFKQQIARYGAPPECKDDLMNKLVGQVQCWAGGSGLEALGTLTDLNFYVGKAVVVQGFTIGSLCLYHNSGVFKKTDFDLGTPNRKALVSFAELASTMVSQRVAHMEMGSVQADGEIARSALIKLRTQVEEQQRILTEIEDAAFKSKPKTIQPPEKPQNGCWFRWCSGTSGRTDRVVHIS